MYILWNESSLFSNCISASLKKASFAQIMQMKARAYIYISGVLTLLNSKSVVEKTATIKDVLLNRTVQIFAPLL